MASITHLKNTIVALEDGHIFLHLQLFHLKWSNIKPDLQIIIKSFLVYRFTIANRCQDIWKILRQAYLFIFTFLYQFDSSSIAEFSVFLDKKSH